MEDIIYTEKDFELVQGNNLKVSICDSCQFYLNKEHCKPEGLTMQDSVAVRCGFYLDINKQKKEYVKRRK